MANVIINTRIPEEDRARLDKLQDYWQVRCPPSARMSLSRTISSVIARGLKEYEREFGLDGNTLQDAKERAQHVRPEQRGQR